MLIIQKHLNAIHRRLTSKTQRNPTLYAKGFASVSGDRWVSLYISAMVGAWAADVFFLKRGSLGIIRSTQPTKNDFLKLTPMVRLGNRTYHGSPILFNDFNPPIGGNSGNLR